MPDTTRKPARGMGARAHPNPIADIIADGYDIGESTFNIADAVADWIICGTPNPFEDEANAIARATEEECPV